MYQLQVFTRQNSTQGFMSFYPAAPVSKGGFMRLLVFFSILLTSCAYMVSAQLPSDAQLDSMIVAHRTTRVTITGDPGVQVNIQQQRHAFPFGTAISRKAFNGDMAASDVEKYLDTLETYFNAGVVENAMKWKNIEPEKDQYSFTNADKIADWCAEKNIELRGHTVFWGRLENNWGVPAWQETVGDAELRTRIREHARVVIQRYKDQFLEWDLLNEPVHWKWYENQLGQGIHGDMFRWAHAEHPEAKLYVNDFDIVNGSSDYVDYVNLIKGWLADGVPVHGIGAQGHFFRTADASDVWNALEALKELELPIKITEFDAGGRELRQAKQLEAVYRTAFAHPSIVGITAWGFWDGRHWRDGGGWWASDWQPKQASQRYKNLVFGEWWTDTTITLDSEGNGVVHCFQGKYDITVNGTVHKEEFPMGTTDAQLSFASTEVSPQLLHPGRGAIPRKADRVFTTNGRACRNRTLQYLPAHITLDPDGQKRVHDLR